MSTHAGTLDEKGIRGVQGGWLTDAQRHGRRALQIPASTSTQQSNQAPDCAHSVGKWDSSLRTDIQHASDSKRILICAKVTRRSAMILRQRRFPIVCAISVLLASQPGLLSAGEAPESIHRRACTSFPRERVMQRMWAESTMAHRTPLRYGCSSLEGASCFYLPRPLPSATSAAGLKTATIALTSMLCSVHLLQSSVYLQSAYM